MSKPSVISRLAPWWQPALTVLTVGVLLCLAAANIALRMSWHEVEDGVLWRSRPEGVVAVEVAPGSAGEKAGVRPADILLAIDGRQVESTLDVRDALHRGDAGSRLTYTVMRLGAPRLTQIVLQPVPQGSTVLYFLMAAVGAFTLLVELSVRLRRPVNQATLHFFWLCVAFFGVFAFSFSGRFDRLDWLFYWSDVVSILLLAPLFIHFALVFPERPNAWVRSKWGRVGLPALYAPTVLIGGGRVVVLAQGPGRGFGSFLASLDRIEFIYLGVCLLVGLGILVRALGRVRSVTARRQLRWIVWGANLGALPFTIFYILPYGLGLDPLPYTELTVLSLGLVPLAFASAIVRYRLMDVEVIIKRGLVYAAAVSAIVLMYALLLRLASTVFLGGSEQYNSIIAVLATLVVVLLANPVKNAIQTTLDRAYYRDRYDYRRALVRFARDLNSDLDLPRLSDRLVARVHETLVVDRMALMLTALGDGPDGSFRAIRAVGFGAGEPPPLPLTSAVAQRLLVGHTVSLDDPISARRFPAEEVEFWHRHGLRYFVPCQSKEGTIAVMALGGKESGEPLNSEDVALLAAVAGQVATAVENGRLYQQLGEKAAELDRLRTFSENVIESLNDGLAVVDRDDRVVRWNQELERLYGIARADAIGRPLDSLFDAGFLETLRAARKEHPGAPTVFRVSLPSRHPERSQRVLVNTAVAPLRTDGETAGTILIFEDITSRVQLEEQLQISEKMASIGLLAAGVAHEVNTPLTGISSFTQMLLDGADNEDPRTRLLEKIERQTFRAAKIVNSLLNLARPAHVDTGPVDLNAVINDVLSLLEHRLRTSNIKVRKDLADPPPIVSGIDHKLQQVFLNLFMNARDAMPHGGWLSITTKHQGPYTHVEVGDTGSGIPSEHLSRIYDPFFTTKAIGQGTGLGLSITYGIVQEHKGSITCQSTVEQGTRFLLTLPVLEEARARSAGSGA